MTVELPALDPIRLAQRRWARLPISRRVAVIRRFRGKLAESALQMAETIPARLPGALHRSPADTVASEVLPLLEACRFLEREAAWILRAREPDSSSRPAWLKGVETRIERAPWGVVLVLAAANYPLLLAGVPALQALVAGNAVLWKPAPGTEAAAFACKTLLLESAREIGGDLHELLESVVTVLGTGIESATAAMDGGVDHVVLTGSAATGRAVLRKLAETVTPATMELSGCDAVFVFADAHQDRVAEALAFGMRFNGSFTCMAPRRVFLIGKVGESWEMRLAEKLAALEPVAVPAATLATLRDWIANAHAEGAEILLDGTRHTTGEDAAAQVTPTLIVRAHPGLLAMRTEIFAPILTVMRATCLEEALSANAACPYALTAAIFGGSPGKAGSPANRLAEELQAGSVLLNSLILPTSDPRAPFGGRGAGGFGVTRGAEGLLAMTTPKTIQRQRGSPRNPPRAWQPTNTPAHTRLMVGLAQVLHSRGLAARWRGFRSLMRAAMDIRKMELKSQHQEEKPCT